MNQRFDRLRIRELHYRQGPAVDELRLMVFPVVLGAGERLFGETSHPKPLRLVDTQTIGSGLVFVSYQPVGHA